MIIYSYFRSSTDSVATIFVRKMMGISEFRQIEKTCRERRNLLSWKEYFKCKIFFLHVTESKLESRQLKVKMWSTNDKESWWHSQERYTSTVSNIKFTDGIIQSQRENWEDIMYFFQFRDTGHHHSDSHVSLFLDNIRSQSVKKYEIRKFRIFHYRKKYVKIHIVIHIIATLYSSLMSLLQSRKYFGQYSK